MATETKKKLPVPSFRKDINAAEGKAAAAAVLAGKRIQPLKVPAGVKSATGKDGTKYSRWSESMVITHAYRTVTTNGLLNLKIGGKVRQSEANDNAIVFFDVYMNTDDIIPEGHVDMNKRADGILYTLAEATGLMPKTGILSVAALNKLFPEKDAPGQVSPLVTKAVIANITQKEGPQKDKKTKKVVLDETTGKPVIQVRDEVEAFLPDEA